MNFLKLFLRTIAVLPSLIQGIESVYGAKTGEQKKAAAMEIVNAAVKTDHAVESKTIVNPPSFQEGLGKIIDGIVECLNASLWAK